MQQGHPSTHTGIMSWPPTASVSISNFSAVSFLLNIYLAHPLPSKLLTLSFPSTPLRFHHVCHHFLFVLFCFFLPSFSICLSPPFVTHFGLGMCVCVSPEKRCQCFPSATPTDGPTAAWFLRSKVARSINTSAQVLSIAPWACASEDQNKQTLIKKHFQITFPSFEGLVWEILEGVVDLLKTTQVSDRQREDGNEVVQQGFEDLSVEWHILTVYCC